MSSSLSYDQQALLRGGPQTAGGAGADLRAFQAAHTRAWAGALLARLAGRRSRLLSDAELLAGRPARGARAGGLRAVPISRIVASEGRSLDFDRRFRPLRTHTWDRWRSVYAALSRGEALPPVELLEADGRYIVRDGHHRISVAAALGQGEVDAQVTVLDVG